MAYSEEQWIKIRGYFEAGRSLSEIATYIQKEYRIKVDSSTISKRAKIQQWEKGARADIVKAKVFLAEQKSIANSTPLEKVLHECAEDVADDIIRRKNLIYDGLELIAKKTTDLIKNGKIEEKVGVGDGCQNFKEKKIGTKELKEASEALTTIGKSLGVIEKDGMTINNNQQNNTSISAAQMIFAKMVKNQD